MKGSSPPWRGDLNEIYVEENRGGLYLLICVTAAEVCDARDDHLC
jgi:hypothetical protein